LGCDFSITFANICNDKQLAVVCANNLYIPYRTDIFDFTISVAVIHHFSTHERRLQAVSELVRITRVGGLIYIQVWAMEQPDCSKRKFTTSDNFVSWGSNKHQRVYNRFYHIFVEGELQQLLANLPNISIKESFYEHGNWGVVLTKLY
jgi:tRNA (uracil-5-)-methyltransferase TRM9